MFRAVPFDNHICEQRRVDRKHELHRRRLRNLKATSKTNARRFLDNNAPKNFRHMKVNLKKKQRRREWNERVERENSILLEKMVRS